MTEQEKKQLERIAELPPWLVRKDLTEFLAGVGPESPKQPKLRTLTQNAALHKDCELIASKLNSAGLDMRVVLSKYKVEVEWTSEAVKEYLWRPVMRIMYDINSTTELKKTEGQIDAIHETLMKHLGEKHGIEWHDFPCNKKESAVQFMQVDNIKNKNYPKYEGPPKI